MSDPTPLRPIASTNPVTPTDVWRWRAHYDDQSIFEEYDTMGRGHGWGEVDHAQVVTIEMVPQREGVSQVMCEIPPGATPMVERRRNIAHKQATLHAWDAGTITVIGWDHPSGAVHRVYLRNDGLVATSYRHIT